MTQDPDATKIKKTLSVKRFESYRCSPNDSDEQVLAGYLRNIQLSEALYPAFSILEVTLRNQLHHALSHKTQTQSWYTHQPEILAPAEQTEIQKAKDYLLQHGKPGKFKQTTEKSHRIFQNCTIDKGLWLIWTS